MGAWIEIGIRVPYPHSGIVAPFVGAWIEMWLSACASATVASRSLRGSVDCNKIDQAVEINFCIDFFVKMWIEIRIL